MQWIQGPYCRDCTVYKFMQTLPEVAGRRILQVIVILPSVVVYQVYMWQLFN